MSTRTGQFLIAASTLEDPNFHRTVILIVRDDETGTLGLVLNRPMETTVRDALAANLSADCEVEAPLHLGGPCEGLLTVIHADEDLAELEVSKGVYFTAEREKIQRLMIENPKPAKYFAGYSGWGAGQLDAELGTGSWLLTPAIKDVVFASSGDLWNRVITQVTVGKWIDVDRIPDDPSMN